MRSEPSWKKPGAQPEFFKHKSKHKEAFYITMGKIRIGLMGLGRIGRQIFNLAYQDDSFEVAAISDVGRPEILHHLLAKHMGQKNPVALDGKFLVTDKGKTRLLEADKPGEIPWDVFGVDYVIDATAKFRRASELAPHLDNGAKRVISTVLPEDDLDRVILFGVNEDEAMTSDSLVSAGSASTTATAHVLATILAKYGLHHASMTSVHAYTSDQSLQDYAGPDYRRSRSGAENIIPNQSPAAKWVQKIVPEMRGKFSAYALNVPVQIGSLLDMTLMVEDESVSAEDITDLFDLAAAENPDLFATTDDPIVSSDVKGATQSLVIDKAATLKAGTNIIKLLGWHESNGHARRVLDIIRHYSQLDAVAENKKEVS